MNESVVLSPEELSDQLSANWTRWIEWYKSLPHGFKPSRYRTVVNNALNGQNPSVKTMLRIFSETSFEVIFHVEQLNSN